MTETPPPLRPWASAQCLAGRPDDCPLVHPRDGRRCANPAHTAYPDGLGDGVQPTLDDPTVAHVITDDPDKRRRRRWTCDRCGDLVIRADHVTGTRKEPVYACESRCPLCRHAPHNEVGFCPNLASDNDCGCPGERPDGADGIPDDEPDGAVSAAAARFATGAAAGFDAEFAASDETFTDYMSAAADEFAGSAIDDQRKPRDDPHDDPHDALAAAANVVAWPDSPTTADVVGRIPVQPYGNNPDSVDLAAQVNAAIRKKGYAEPDPLAEPPLQNIARRVADRANLDLAVEVLRDAGWVCWPAVVDPPALTSGEVKRITAAHLRLPPEAALDTVRTIIAERLTNPEGAS